MLDRKCGVPSWCSAVQRLSEVQVRTGAGFGRTAGGRFGCGTTGGFVFAAGFCPKPDADQFSAEFPLVAGGDEMVSSGIFGVVRAARQKKSQRGAKRDSRRFEHAATPDFIDHLILKGIINLLWLGYTQDTYSLKPLRFHIQPR